MVLLALGGSIVHPRFRVGDGIDRTDGVLDVVVFDPPTFWNVVTTFGWMAFRRPERSPWHHHFRCRSVRLESDEPVPFELDGSYRGEPCHLRRKCCHMALSSGYHRFRHPEKLKRTSMRVSTCQKPNMRSPPAGPSF